MHKHKGEGQLESVSSLLLLELYASNADTQLLQESSFMQGQEERGWGVQLGAASLGLSLGLSLPTPRFLCANNLLARLAPLTV